MEILKAEVRTNESHSFTFSQPVQQYMVGFSSFVLKYDSPDHHVKEISVDLSNVAKNDNVVIVTPQLKLNDNSGHHQSSQSYITVVVVAAIGNGNPNLQLIPIAKTDCNYDLSASNPAFLKAAISSTFTKYPGSDHHLFQYESSIKPNVQSSSFSLEGKSYIRDKGKSAKVEGNGEVVGSVISYSCVEKDALFADFNSLTNGEMPTICLGNAPGQFYFGDYNVGIFINGFNLSFEKRDHHVLQIKVSAALSDKELILESGRVYAKLSLESFLTDNGENPTKIPHNYVSGFIVALKK